MIDESVLTKGQLRKLVALRKFWVLRSLTRRSPNGSASRSRRRRPTKTEQVIADALWGLIEEGRLSIRRGGYVIRRGRGRVIVEARES